MPVQALRCRPAAKPAASRLRFALVTALLAALLAAARFVSAQSGAAEEERAGLAKSDVVAVTRFVDSFVAQAVAILTDESLAPDERDEAFRAMLLAGFDTHGGARFALGRGWRIATQDQRDEFVALFRQELLRLGKELFEGYQEGELLEVRRVRPVGTGKFMAETKLTNPAARIDDVDFMVRRSDAGLQIVDVQLEGFSLLETYRTKFVAPLFHGGVERVLRLLRPHDAY